MLLPTVLLFSHRHSTILLLVKLQRGSIMVVRQLVCPTIVFNHIVFSSLLLNQLYLIDMPYHAYIIVGQLFLCHTEVHITQALVLPFRAYTMLSPFVLCHEHVPLCPVICFALTHDGFLQVKTVRW